MNFWVKHPRARQPDTMLTLAVVSTAVVLIKFLLAGVTVSVGGASFVGGAIDSGVVAAILASTLGAYVARKYQSPHKEDKDESQS